MFSNVIVGVDGRQGGRDAIHLARQLADTDAQATLAHVYGESEGPPGSGTVLLADQRIAAHQLIAHERERLWPAADTVCRMDASPGRALHEIAAEREADLLVVGSCRRGYVGRVLLGDDTRAAFNGAPCALAIAPHSYALDGHIGAVGVGYDGSPESEQALQAARRLADAIGAKIEAMWVISLEDVRQRAPLPADWPTASEELVAEAQARLDEIPGITGHAVYGGPREELFRLSRRVDLLVVGSRGYGPWDSLFHGSVSSYLERHARSALLVLRRERATETSAAADAHPTAAATA